MMKKFLLILVLGVVCSENMNGQKKALTELGEEVILYDNGTWKYVKESNESEQIPTNSKSYKKSEGATFLLKSSKVNSGFWLNPQKWTFSKSPESEATEYKLSYKKGDLYGMIITEKIEIGLDELGDAAFQNAKDAAPDVEVVNKEYRNINNNKVLMIQMSGTIKGIKFTYLGYYYSNKSGTVQFITYTSQNIFAEEKDELEELLNGMITLN